MAVLYRTGVSDSERRVHSAAGSTKDGGKLDLAMGMLGASLTAARSGKALSDRPALEPYRGKPAVRNLRGDDGNVGIMRSPISAIVLPDPILVFFFSLKVQLVGRCSGPHVCDIESITERWSSTFLQR